MLAHIRFLANASILAAKRLRDSIYADFNLLAENPNGYRRYDSKDCIENLHCKLCAKRYRIVFEVIDDTVYIYDIQDCRQDIDKNLV